MKYHETDAEYIRRLEQIAHEARIAVAAFDNSDSDRNGWVKALRALRKALSK